MIGEHVLRINPDCTDAISCLPSVQDIEVESVTVHEDWDIINVGQGNDIALVRLARPAALYYVSKKLTC